MIFHAVNSEPCLDRFLDEYTSRRLDQRRKEPRRLEPDCSRYSNLTRGLGVTIRHRVVKPRDRDPTRSY